jgi:hypothetical protein
MFIISFFSKYLFIFSFFLSSLFSAEPTEEFNFRLISARIISFCLRNEGKKNFWNDHMNLLGLFLIRSKSKILSLLGFTYILSSFECQDENETVGKKVSQIFTRLKAPWNRFLEYYKEEIDDLEKCIIKEKIAS